MWKDEHFLYKRYFSKMYRDQKVLVNCTLWITIANWLNLGEKSKIDFFQVFHFKLYFHFHNHKSLYKMWSFEVHYVGVAQKMGPLEAT